MLENQRGEVQVGALYGPGVFAGISCNTEIFVKSHGNMAKEVVAGIGHENITVIDSDNAICLQWCK